MTEQHTATTRPRFSITEAASLCGVHADTIRRKISALAEHGAEKDESGAWTIPVEALLAVGLKPGRPAPPDSPAQPSPAVAATLPEQVVPVAEVEALRNEVAALKHQLELEQVRRETAERLVDVHREALDESRAWRRILEAGPSSRIAPSAPEPGTQPTPSSPPAPAQAAPQATQIAPSSPQAGTQVGSRWGALWSAVRGQ